MVMAGQVISKDARWCFLLDSFSWIQLTFFQIADSESRFLVAVEPCTFTPIMSFRFAEFFFRFSFSRAYGLSHVSHSHRGR